MRKYITLFLSIVCICCLFGCGKQEQQGDNNMQYFFGGKVIAVDEEYLILEVFDTGNSNLTEGAKIEVSTDVVAAKGCPDFEVDEYAKVLMARTTDDELGDNEVLVNLYSIKDGDEVFIGSSTLSSKETHRKIVFANLTSANNYKIGVSVGSIEESITIKIADE